MCVKASFWEEISEGLALYLLDASENVMVVHVAVVKRALNVFVVILHQAKGSVNYLAVLRSKELDVCVPKAFW